MSPSAALLAPLEPEPSIAACPLSRLDFETSLDALDQATARKLGFRVGPCGTHTSRTMMLAELSQLLASTPVDASRAQYADAVVEQNCLGKRTASNRRISLQHLSELYGLDDHLPLFRVLRHLWRHHDASRPMLALLLALARDPLLRATVGTVLAHTPHNELARQRVKTALADAVGDRLRATTLDKTVRNIASSWTQSGHLRGRSRKIRQTAEATPAATAYALWLGHLVGQRGSLLFETPWTAVLDTPFGTLLRLAIDAKRLGMLDLKHSGSMIDVSFPTLLGVRS